MLKIAVFTRLAINAVLFYWVVLGNICVSTVSLLLACIRHTCSSFRIINTVAGTPHCRHCQIVLPSFGNSSLAIQSFMSLNIIRSVVLHLVFKSVANTCFLCSGLMFVVNPNMSSFDLRPQPHLFDMPTK